MHGGCRQDLLDKRGMGKQRWRLNYAFSIQHTNNFMGEHGKVENRRTAVRLVRMYVQLFFYIGCCCASPVVWCKQKHICASLCRIVCSMVTFVMWTVPLVYRLYSVKRHGSGFGIPNEPWWVIYIFCLEIKKMHMLLWVSNSVSFYVFRIWRRG